MRSWHRRCLGAAVALALAGSAIAWAETTTLTSDPAQAKGGTYVLDKDHGKITWAISHLGFSTYVGQFTDVEAKLNLNADDPTKSTLDVTVAMDSVGTFNQELDKHLKSAEFFDVAKYPTATFKATKIEVTGEKTGTISGDLTMHGVTKPVRIQATFNQAGQSPVDKVYKVGFSGETTIKRSDFGIDAYVPAVGDMVKLDIEGEFKRAE